MTWHDIPLAEWPEFLRQFSHEHRAWIAEVERTASGTELPETVTRRFIAAHADIRNSRATAIELRFLQEDEADDTLRIPGPTTLSAEETSDGAVQGIDIEAQDGRHVRVHFRGVAQPDVFLDGIAPGELM